MNTNNAFDWVDNLEESGMTKEQAMAVARIFNESHETLMKNMREMLDARFENLETKLETKLENLATKADVKEDIGKLSRFTAILWLSVMVLMVASLIG